MEGRNAPKTCVPTGCARNASVSSIPGRYSWTCPSVTTPEGMTCNQPRCGRGNCLESGKLFGDDLGQLCFYDGSPASSQTLPLHTPHDS